MGANFARNLLRNRPIIGATGELLIGTMVQYHRDDGLASSGTAGALYASIYALLAKALNTETHPMNPRLPSKPRSRLPTNGCDQLLLEAGFRQVGFHILPPSWGFRVQGLGITV